MAQRIANFCMHNCSGAEPKMILPRILPIYRIENRSKLGHKNWKNVI